MGNWIFLDELVINLNDVRAVKYFECSVCFYLKDGESIEARILTAYELSELKDAIKKALTKEMPIPKNIKHSEGLLNDFKSISDTLNNQ